MEWIFAENIYVGYYALGFCGICLFFQQLMMWCLMCSGQLLTIFSLSFFSFLSLLSPFLPYNVLFPYILPTYPISDTQMANIFRFPSYPESWLCINVKKNKTLQSVRMIFNMPCLVPTTQLFDGIIPNWYSTLALHSKVSSKIYLQLISKKQWIKSFGNTSEFFLQVRNLRLILCDPELLD